MDKNHYNYVSMGIKEVMDNIEKFVIPENREAIEYLWDLNILTTQTNNYDNQSSFICIGSLSEKNENVFWDYYNSHLHQDKNLPMMGIIYGGRGIEIPIKPGTKNTFQYFKPFIDLLSYQDVQKDGYMTIPEFFTKYTDCWSLEDNPYYHPLVKPNVQDYVDLNEYYHAVDRYIESRTVCRKIKLFDERKVIKDLTDYLKETGFENCYDPEEGKIYYHPRLLESHMRYKNYQDFLHNKN